MRGLSLSAKGRAGLRIFSAVLGLGILGGRMAPAEGAEPVTDHQVITLWPGGAPGAKGNDPEQDIPTLTVWLAKPETATGAAVVVCPGGGSGMLASDHEGRQVARLRPHHDRSVPDAQPGLGAWEVRVGKMKKTGQ